MSPSAAYNRLYVRGAQIAPKYRIKVERSAWFDRDAGTFQYDEGWWADVYQGSKRVSMKWGSDMLTARRHAETWIKENP